MEQIRTIYREVFSKSPAAIGADQKLTEEIEQEIEERKRKSRTSPHRRGMDIRYLPAAVTAVQGFESGFRYAMTLIAESLWN